MPSWDSANFMTNVEFVNFKDGWDENYLSMCTADKIFRRHGASTD